MSASRYDVVIVWRFDRFARTVKQLVLALEEFQSLNIDFVSHREALDTSSPMGRAMFQIIAVMVELERAVIHVPSASLRDRTHFGLVGSYCRPMSRVLRLEFNQLKRWAESGGRPTRKRRATPAFVELISSSGIPI